MLSEELPLGQQGLQGVVVQCIISPITEQQFSAVARKAFSSVKALNAEELHIWDSIRSLDNVASLPNVALPTNLRSITFDFDFDQGLAKMELPIGLRSITFGYHFQLELETNHQKTHCFISIAATTLIFIDFH